MLAEEVGAVAWWSGVPMKELEHGGEGAGNQSCFCFPSGSAVLSSFHRLAFPILRLSHSASASLCYHRVHPPSTSLAVVSSTVHTFQGRTSPCSSYLSLYHCPCPTGVPSTRNRPVTCRLQVTEGVHQPSSSGIQSTYSGWLGRTRSQRGTWVRKKVGA